MTTLRFPGAFSGGEITPRLRARVDTTKYQSGVSKARNVFVAKEGILDNRSGFEFVCEVKDSEAIGKLGRFVFNSDSGQVYVLELGDEYMRFIQDGARVTVSGVTAWSGATAYVVGDLASRLGVNYYCILGHTNQQPPNATYWYPLTGSIYEIPTPYATEDLAELHLDTQSGDVVTISHPSHDQMKLTRTGHTTWTLTDYVYEPEIDAPTSPAVSGGTSTGLDWRYRVTAVSADTGEESLPSSTATLSNKGTPTSAAPNVFSWVAPSGNIKEYNVYRERAIKTGNTAEGKYGYLDTVTGLAYNDDATSEPDFSDGPPSARDPFSGADDKPSCSTYYQQRLMNGNLDSNPEGIEGSRAGYFTNFTQTSEEDPNDAVSFTLAGRQVNEVRHLIDIGTLAALTTGGAHLIRGDEAGQLKRTAINARQESYHGSSILLPHVVNNTVVYVQSAVGLYGNVVRDLLMDFDKLVGADLTFYSSHLFRGYTLVDSAYQQLPHSILWYVRSDGKLLSCTYIKEQEILAWTVHDTDGEFENVVCVPEGTETALYALIKRTIDGDTKRYIERMTTRLIDDPREMIFMDSALTYDGRNTDDSHTMTISNGTDYDYEELLRLTSSTGYFVSGDVGNYIHLRNEDGDLVRFEIKSFSSTTVVSGSPLDGIVPADMRAVAISDWGKAVDAFSGLDHLEGKTVSILGDGYVVSSPNNEKYTTEHTVTSGAVTLSVPREVVQIGLPYVSDIVTLDLDFAGATTLADTKKLVVKVLIHQAESRGGWYGPELPEGSDLAGPDQGMTELRQRSDEEYDSPIDLQTGTDEIVIDGKWSKGGQVAVRFVDPLPASILCISPTVGLADRS